MSMSTRDARTYARDQFGPDASIDCHLFGLLIGWHGELLTSPDADHPPAIESQYLCETCGCLHPLVDTRPAYVVSDGVRRGVGVSWEDAFATLA